MLQSAQKLPKKPGVYLFKNKDKQVIYVGKAINLNSRVKSYFQKSTDLAADKRLMVNEIKKIEYILVDNELEALYLESNLIKKYHPRYNIILRDDKFFVYIKIPKEEFSRVLLTRRIIKDQSRYFGPYLSAKQAKSVLFSLRKIFPHRLCNILSKSVCLEYHLGHCNAPCIGAVDRKEYQAVIDNIVSFLRGQYEPVLLKLKKQMADYSAKQEYEKAARLRDQMAALTSMMAKQKVISPKMENQDVVSLTREKDWGAINLLSIRMGKLVSSQNFVLEHLANQTASAIISSFVKQYYAKTHDFPQAIITDQKIALPELNKLTGAKIILAQKGKKKNLIKMSRKNAQEFLLKKETFIQKRKKEITKALKELSSVLQIKVPGRIEAYDIANISGQNAVGSMIVFTAGEPDKNQYRKFAIKTFISANDPGMIKEVLVRRFSKKRGWLKPDLILIDGGKSQLNAALSALKQHKQKIPIMALAKRLEEIYIPRRPKAFTLNSHSPALYFIQRIRDEAHRFATGFYQQKHLKKIIKSELDGIPGLGPKNKRLLKKEFGSLANIKKAKSNRLRKIIGSKLAQIIKAQLSD